MSKAIVVTLAASVIVVLAGYSYLVADTIAQYDFGTVGLATYDATTVDPNASATSMAPGAGIAPPQDWALLDGWPWAGAVSLQAVCPWYNTELGVLNYDGYFGFTATANPGYELNLTQLAWDATIHTGFQGQWFLYTDVDGFTYGSSVDSASIPLDAVNFTSFAVNLSAPKYQGLDSIEFRIYVNTYFIGGRIAWDNITLSGTVPGPPSIPGDADGDGKIDGADLARWQQNYDPTGSNAPNNNWDMGDWDDNQKIDGADLALWQQNYDPVGTIGSFAGTQAIPEPTTLLLLGTSALGLLGTACRRRSR